MLIAFKSIIVLCIYITDSDRPYSIFLKRFVEISSEKGSYENSIHQHSVSIIHSNGNLKKWTRPVFFG